MVFSSSIFLFYFLPVFLVVYYLVGRKYKNGVALFASLLFYGFGSPKFLLILLTSILIDYFLVREIDHSTEARRRKLFLTFSVILNLGLLAYFKYANFFVDNFNALLSVMGTNPVRWTKVVLPIGISFFTFQKMSYSIDVYRKTSAPLKSFADYALFIMLFPQLIAGPIVRYNEIADQITDRRANETIDNKILGFYRFIIGLSKKMLIANILAEYVDQVFALPTANIGTGTAWLGILAYTFQIYFDFSGYSDMAIGQQSLYQPQRVGVLETLAHHPRHLDDGLPLHPAGRQPQRQSPYLPQPLDRLLPLRFVAWCRLELRGLGRLPWAVHLLGQALEGER